jgi:hypothetical protein
MKIMNTFKNIISGFSRSLKRFPLTLLLSASVAIILITMSEIRPAANSNLEETLGKIALTLGLGIPISLCIKLYFERRDSKNSSKILFFYFLGALALVLYYIFLLKNMNTISITRYISVSLALYLAFLYMPYLPRKENFEMYTIKIFTSFFTTVIYSVVLFLGLAAILFTIDNLLGINIESNFYYYTWLLVVFFFAVSYFLSELPFKNILITSENYPKLLKILVLYIIMPLLTAYTTILYIYFIKILITRQWPQGLVSHLVLWYSVIVVVVLFFINPLKEKNSWPGIFSRWIPKVILPIIVMMFISIWIRINAYGVTENRYFVVVLGLWVTGIMLYYSLRKIVWNIALPLSLSVIAIISVFGPLSSFNISKMSQNNRLEGILSKNNMISEGKVQKSPESISKESKNEISRILDYFDNKHSLKDVRILSDDFKIEDMNKVFGFPHQSYDYESNNGYFYYMRNQSEKVVDISGYDYLIDNRSLYENNPSNTINAVYDQQSAILKLTYKGTEVYSKDLKLFANQLNEKYGISSKENTLPSEEMTLYDENNTVKVKILIMNISGEKPTNTDKLQIHGIDFYLLIKIK